jgi:hypothetical protein
VTKTWRFDWMATVCDPGSGRITASFAGVAKHYGVSVAVCPPRRGNRKGVVEKVNHTAAQRWWRTLPDDVTVEQAQASLDRFASLRGDTRMRASAGGRSTVATLAKTEPLTPVAAQAYPVIVTQERAASRQALVAYRGNRYSVPPSWPWPRSRSATRWALSSSTSPPTAGSSLPATGCLPTGWAPPSATSGT